MESTRSETTQPLVKIVSDKVALGPHRRDLLPLYHRWLNDFDVTRTSGSRFRTRTWESMGAWYDHASNGGPGFVDFTISERVTMRPIGWTSLEDIDHFDRTAKVIILIEEKGLLGQRIWYRSHHAGAGPRFHWPWAPQHFLTVFSFNERGIRAYRRAGFQIIGCRHEAHRLSARAFDVIYMDCLGTDFQDTVLTKMSSELE